MYKMIFRLFIFLSLCSSVQYGVCQSTEKQLIFPVPASIEIGQGIFSLDTGIVIINTVFDNKQENVLGKLLYIEKIDKYGLVLKTRNRSGVNDKEKNILIGTLSNNLVKTYCDQKGLTASLKTLGNDGYVLSVTDNKIVIAANTKEGTLWGLSSLRQLIQKEKGALIVPQLLVKDAPVYSFRGIKLYLPGKENIQFFKRFIKDFVALYKFNKIILELNANMRLDKHPELNIGAVNFAKHLKYSRLDRPPGVHQEYQNSSHQDNADGQILEKEEVAELVNYIRRFGIEVIPELPSLTHSYYLLAGHEELAENPNQPFPDTYCPLKPGSYKLYFDVLDEYIEVIKPSMIHVGHDEWRMEKDICELCRGKDFGLLYANDLKKIHGYLADKGIKTAIWGDHLLESVTEKDHQTWKSSTGYTYKIPGALKPEQVLNLIPKDILIF
ncbi:MAG TPA: glycoside hydrolase family 20 zincin-like fold domain-containing protein, partial [Chitinophagaceae bacterium]